MDTTRLKAICENCKYARIGITHYAGKCMLRKIAILRKAWCECFHDKDYFILTAIDTLALAAQLTFNYA